MSDDRYRVRYTRTARRAFADELPPRIVDAVLALLDGDLAAEPHRVGKPLREPLDGTWTARRGTYRIVYEIDDDARTVLITGIEARADAYRPHRPHPRPRPGEPALLLERNSDAAVPSPIAWSIRSTSNQPTTARA